MKKIYTSIVAAAILSTGAYAESNSIKDAFANGKTSGDISLYSEYVSKNGTSKDSAFTMSSIGLNYETDSFMGLKGALGARTNHKFTEKENADFDETTPKTALSTANISYSTDKAALVVGRQAIDLEWIEDYHEAVVAVLSYVPDTTIVVGHTERKMAVDNDAALATMTDIGTNNDGANVIDVKYEGIANTVINPYFMDAKDTFSAYGLKATTNVANIDLTAHYAATSEDVVGTKDGSIAHLAVGTTIENISLAAGYIATDKDGGIGTISALGDKIDPTEDIGTQVYGTNADTFYGSISAEVSIVTLGAQYTTVKYDTATTTDDRVSEILLTAGAAITDELSLNVLFSSVNAELSADDTDKVTAMLAYSF
jgi:hypothetical protein